MSDKEKIISFLKALKDSDFFIDNRRAVAEWVSAPVRNVGINKKKYLPFGLRHVLV